MGKNGQPRRIKSVDRTLDIVEALRDNDSMTVTELAETVDLSPGTVHTYLATLEDRGYVCSESGVYRLGLFLLPMGEYIRASSDLYKAAKSVVDELADETGEAIHLVVESNWYEIQLYEQFGSDAVGEELYIQNKGVPKRNLHCSAAGKAILAHLDEERREEILANCEFAERTPATITDAEALREELRSIRDRGIAFNDEEQIQGLRAVGAPITTEGTIQGGISLSAPVSRLEGERFRSTFPDHARQAANIVEVNLQAT
ncbi:IclR family transcriptional regulator [Halomicrobium urmianum]|uniref:IclR family transcriptional regulator n=1 Tax=Halomicrobium urmianum TaxID=1586233 RepID=UPI001CDA399C|nr:IclR family transcriptional regulator [Halomicrobium urmianum]